MTTRDGPAAPETTGPKNIDPPGTRIDVARVARGPDVAVALRRRREAALRCPRLVSGVRDPLDVRASRSLPRAAGRAAWLHLRDVELIDGDGWQAGVLARGAAP